MAESTRASIPVVDITENDKVSTMDIKGCDLEIVEFKEAEVESPNSRTRTRIVLSDDESSESESEYDENEDEAPEESPIEKSGNSSSQYPSNQKFEHSPEKPIPDFPLGFRPPIEMYIHELTNSQKDEAEGDDQAVSNDDDIGAENEDHIESDDCDYDDDCHCNDEVNENAVKDLFGSSDDEIEDPIGDLSDEDAILDEKDNASNDEDNESINEDSEPLGYSNDISNEYSREEVQRLHREFLNGDDESNPFRKIKYDYEPPRDMDCFEQYAMRYPGKVKRQGKNGKLSRKGFRVFWKNYYAMESSRLSNWKRSRSYSDEDDEVDEIGDDEFDQHDDKVDEHDEFDGKVDETHHKEQKSEVDDDLNPYKKQKIEEVPTETFAKVFNFKIIKHDPTAATHPQTNPDSQASIKSRLISGAIGVAIGGAATFFGLALSTPE